MKTTIESFAAHIEAARQMLAEWRTRLHAFLEASLRRVRESLQPSTPFRLRDRSFAGNGLQPGFSHDRWSDQRDAVYDGRGS